MTRLLRLYIKVLRTLKENSYEQKNSIYEQIIKRLNEKRQDTLLQDDNILLQIK